MLRFGRKKPLKCMLDRYAAQRRTEFFYQTGHPWPEGKARFELEKRRRELTDHRRCFIGRECASMRHAAATSRNRVLTVFLNSCGLIPYALENAAEKLVGER